MLEKVFNLGLCRDYKLYLYYDTFISGQAHKVRRCPISGTSLLSNLLLALTDVRQTGHVFPERT